MTYIDAIHNRKTDQIQVVERVNRKRVFKDYPASYVFYYEDPRGTHKTMWGEPCKKYITHDNKKFQRDLRDMQNSGKKIHEHDINPVFRCLSDNYLNADTPELNIGFFDIEVDFHLTKGFAPPADPFNRITAISIYTSFTEKLYTLVLKPDLPKSHPYYLSWDEAASIADKFDNTILCDDELDLLKKFLTLVDDVDVLTGWNSTGFDIPYVVNRINRVLGKDYSNLLCLFGQSPKKRKYTKYKKEHETYDLVGRVHLDYLELFQKHSSAEVHSYKLDHVGELIVGENKTPYDGSLDDLYKQDFEKFIQYNRQDTLLLVKIDAKCRYIELASQLAHTNSVLLPTTMGSVALVEQAIVNETWSLGLQVMSRAPRDFVAEALEDDDDEDEDEDDGNAFGAYVADPKAGRHKMIGCVDINSLYPSTIRALNMGPETIVGQIRSDRTEKLIADRMAKAIEGTRRAKGSKTDAAHGLFATLEYDIMNHKAPDNVVLELISGENIEISGKDLHSFVFAPGSNYCISANGTIFRTDKKGVIPGLLERWYAQRKEMRAKAYDYTMMEKGVEIDDDLLKLLKEDKNV